MPKEEQAASQPLSLVGKFIDKYYLKQKPWVQSSTFIIFVVLFAYGFVNILSGSKVLTGNVWVKTPGPCGLGSSCTTLAKFYDIRWGARPFASNAMGEYNVTVGFAEYFSILAAGSHEITFFKDDQKICTRSVKLSRLTGEFESVTLPLEPCPETSPQAPEKASLIPRAWADLPAGPYRLLVQGVRFAGGGSKQDVQFDLVLHGSTIVLQDHSHDDMPAAAIPLLANQGLDLGSNFYFPLPGINSLPAQGTIRLKAGGNFFQQFFSSDEEFPLSPSQSLGQAFQVTGSRGSTLNLRVVLSADVKLFSKSDLSGKRDLIEADLLNQGFLTRWSSSPQGFVRETNALWTGPAVPFDIVQRLVRVALSQNIGLKKIQYRYSFQSTSNPTEMQFGYAGSCAQAQPIPGTTLQRAVQAGTESEFLTAIASVSTCSVPTTPVRRSRRSPRR